MRKFGNVFPLVEPPEAAVVVLLLLPPPPHPAAISARQAMTDAAPSHFHTILLFKSYLPVLRFAVAAQRRPQRLSARCILPDVPGPKLVRTALPGSKRLEWRTNVCSPRLPAMQLRLDAADRLVELVEEQRGPVRAEEAARRLFALRQAPVALARSLLADVVETDARLAWSGDAVALADPPGASLLLEEAVYVVVDLETTGLRPGSSGICEIGAVRLRGFEVEAEFETLVDPGLPIAAAASAVTGLRNEQLRGAPRPAAAVRRFLAFAGDGVLVAHNARFDLAFLDRETERLTGSRIGSPVVDTVRLARTLLAGRVAGFGLGQLAWFLGTAERPCHRALPDARATAELLLALIGLAQERGARTVADLSALAATRTRRLLDKRHLAYGAPSRPGVYRFVGRNQQLLYI